MKIKSIKIPVLAIAFLLIISACTNSKIYESDSDYEITTSNSQNTVDSSDATDEDSISTETESTSKSDSPRESESLSDSTGSQTPKPTGSSSISIAPSPTGSSSISITPKPTGSSNVSITPSPAATPTPTKMVRMPVTYYVSSSSGNDANNGISQNTPWKTLEKASSIEYFPGDKILLKANDIWTNGETLVLKGSGTAINPITVSMYGPGNRPKISPNQIDAICISGSGLSGWKIMNLELSNAKTGIDLKYEHDYGNDFIWIENVYFHSMTSAYNSKTYDKITQPQRDAFLDHGNQSGGIYVRTQTNAGATYHFNQPVALTNLTIINSDFYDCEIAIWTGATINGAFQPAGKDYARIDGLRIQNITARKMGMWGINIAFTDNGIISDSHLEDLGFQSNRFGACALLVSYADNVHFDNMTVLNQSRHPDQYFDAVAFDFEGGTSNCSITNSRFVGIDGPGILITYNIIFPNYNMLIENNVIEDFSRSYNESLPAIHWAVKEGVPFSTGIIRNNTFISYRPNLPDFGYAPHTVGNPLSTIQFSNNTLTNRNSMAVGKTITASSSSFLNPPARAVDNNISTFWRAGSTAYPQWLQVDLGAVYSIDTIHQQFSSMSEWKYWVGVSNDPTFATFQTVVDRTGGYNGAFFTDKVGHLNVSGRYVRISFISSGNGLHANSSEFKIFVK